MEVEVYADLLFLINAAMDGLCLLLTGKLLHRKVKPWRVVLASVLGGVYAVAALFPTVGAGMALLLDAAVCLLMCGVVFGGKGGGGLRGLLPSAGVYFLLSMALGGIMTALYHLLNRAGAVELLTRLTGGRGDGLGSWLFLLLALVGGGLSLRVGRLSRRVGRVRTCTVTVELEGARVELCGLVDSGNLLRDPMSGRVVICAEAATLDALLSPEMAAAMAGASPDVASLPPEDAKRVRFIPAETAAGGRLLYGFLPDRILLTPEGETRGREVDAVVAVTDIPTHGVEALVPSELI